MISKFIDIGVSENIVRAMIDMGWKEPTPIQLKSIPVGIRNVDVFTQAQINTGKTGAYGSIILSTIPAGKKIPSSLVIVPTRELTNQVSNEIKKMSKYSGHVCIPIYDGLSVEDQIKKLYGGCDIIIGTPGGIKDIIIRNALNLLGVSIVVFDEADKILDIDFLDDIKFILKNMPVERHTLFFSATIKENIKKIALNYMVNPKRTFLLEDKAVSELTKQYYIPIGRMNKLWALCRVLNAYKPKAIIFCQTKKMVDTLSSKLAVLNYKIKAIHDMPQHTREKVISNFKDGVTSVLIATDTAVRGLDISNINYVINYDMPDDIDIYIHRIGRICRSGKNGMAISFVTSDEKHIIREFAIRARINIKKRNVPDIEPGQKDIIKYVIDYNQISNVFGMCRFKINLGKNDGFREVSLVDFITKNIRINDVSVGNILVGPEYSVVEVHKDFGYRMIIDLPKFKHKNKKIKVYIANQDIC